MPGPTRTGHLRRHVTLYMILTSFPPVPLPGVSLRQFRSRDPLRDPVHSRLLSSGRDPLPRPSRFRGPRVLRTDDSPTSHLPGAGVSVHGTLVTSHSRLVCRTPVSLPVPLTSSPGTPFRAPSPRVAGDESGRFWEGLQRRGRTRFRSNRGADPGRTPVPVHKGGGPFGNGRSTGHQSSGGRHWEAQRSPRFSLGGLW